MNTTELQIIMQVNLRPSKAYPKLGSTHISNFDDKSKGARDVEWTGSAKITSEVQKGASTHLLPRTRDDSSDEEAPGSCEPTPKGNIS